MLITVLVYENCIAYFSSIGLMILVGPITITYVWCKTCITITYDAKLVKQLPMYDEVLVVYCYFFICSFLFLK